MREIIFRGKRKDNGEWVNGDLLQIPSENWTSIMGQTKGTMNYIVDPETVGQYTGVKDADGKRIFEGDIVENERIIGFVFYKECDATFELKWKSTDKHRKDFFKTCYLINYSGLNSLKVIGNIYDNPELVEVEK